MLREILSDIRYRARTILRRRAVEVELDDELRFHLEREIEKYVAAGMSPAEARRRAMVAFGGVSRTKDETREAHGTALVDQLAQDIRYALRGLRARPLFTSVVVLTLGLGVGVNAAMFGVIDRLMFRPPAMMRDPAAVSRVYATWSASDGSRNPQQAFEYRRYQDLARWSRSVESTAAFAYRTIAIGEGESVHEFDVGAVSATFFDFFAAKPALGRFFTAAEDVVPRGADVVVLTWGFWQSQFGGKPEALGTNIRIGRANYKIIGVAPKGFGGIVDRQSPSAFVPITTFAANQNPNYYKNYQWSWINIVVRRKAGVTMTEASADLTAALQRSWNAEREITPGLPAAETVRPEAFAAPVLLARGPLAAPEAKVLPWISGVAFVVLLVACANVANLLLARSLRRRRELAVRRALGGSRARLIRQLLTETMTLSVLGGVAGIVGAQIASGGLQRMFSPGVDPVSILTDGRSLGFALAMTTLTAIFAGLVPALHAGSDDLAGSLRGGMRDSAYRGTRARRSLLVFQTALSVVLLVGAGLFLRSVQGVRNTRLGYDVDPILLVSPNMRGVRLGPVEQEQLVDRLLAEAATVPGVERATVTMSVPFWSFEGRRISVPGVDSVGKLGQFTLHSGTPDFFATIGTRIVQGRGFTRDDRRDTPFVAVVSVAMARALWKNDNPIGKCFRLGSDTMPCTSVVGVAENTRSSKLTDAGEFAYYIPFEQYKAAFGITTPFFYVRVRGRAEEYAEAVRSRMQRVMPGASYITTTPFHEIVDPTMASWTSGAKMFTGLGALALLLAGVGLYAVIAFGVAQRLNELGVRIALGALPRDVTRLVVGEGVRVTLVGVVLGAVISLAGSSAVGPLLYGVSPRDPAVYAAVAAVLILVGMFASLLPALRAARVDPNVALRAE